MSLVQLLRKIVNSSSKKIVTLGLGASLVMGCTVNNYEYIGGDKGSQKDFNVIKDIGVQDKPADMTLIVPTSDFFTGPDKPLIYPIIDMGNDFGTDLRPIKKDSSVADLVVPDIIQPDVAVPDQYVPDLMVPDKMQQDLLVPDKLIPDLPKPDIVVPDQKIADSYVPDLNQPDVAVPDQYVPDLMVPDKGVVCPTNMVLVKYTGGLFCIDNKDIFGKTKSMGIADCKTRGKNGKVCNVKEIDLAVTHIGIKPSHELATTDSTGCCCPCGSYKGPSQHFWTPTGGAHGFKRGKCECWFENRPNVKTFYRCCVKP